MTRLAELAEFYGLTTAELLPTFPATTPPIAGDRFSVDLDRLADLPAARGNTNPGFDATVTTFAGFPFQSSSSDEQG